MTKIAILYNSPYLGGAERSITHQAQIASLEDPTLEFSFIIPQVAQNTSSQIEELIHLHFPQADINFFHYPEHLYSISRSGTQAFSFIETLISLFNVLLALRYLHLHRYDILWCNGNKIATIIGIWAKVARFNKKVLWHFRDYPSESNKFKILWRFFNRQHSYKLTTVSNSYSVQRKVEAVLSHPSITHHMIYNPTGEHLLSRSITSVKTIGIVSMLAPWKGVHQILRWAHFYDKELRSLGIEHIAIYGGNIYSTKGDHQNYAQQLRKLLDRYPSSLITFKGNCSPQEIYSGIDLLIHPVISPEPFGRILMEAFQAKVPIISTALGGSGELVIQEQTGLTFPPYHYATLFQAVEELTIDKNLREKLIQNGFQKNLEIEAQVRNSLSNSSLLSC